MPEINEVSLSYPIGKYTSGANPSDREVRDALESLRTISSRLNAALEGLSAAQLDTTYRDGGWTIKQVVHHVADAHLNAFIRTKLVLTEDLPIVKTFNEVDWANLPDSASDIQPSLQIIDGTHSRWTLLLDGLSDTDWQKMYFHPVMERSVDVKELVAMYGWHANHHLAHITSLKERKGW